MKKNNDKSKYLGKLDETSIPQFVIEKTIEEILWVAEKELHKIKKELVVLDVGSGFGRYSQELGKYVKRVVGVEPFKPAFEKAKILHRKSNVVFYNSLIEDYKTNERFDLVISLTTIEHMPNARKSFRHVLKLMKEKSILYLTAPNRLWPVEPHYNLLFLSWLPLPLANIYLRITGKGLSYKDSSYSRTYFGMKNLFSKLGCNCYFLLPYSSDAAYLGCGKQSLSNKLIRKLGIWLIRKISLFWIISKGFIMIIKKNPKVNYGKKVKLKYLFPLFIMVFGYFLLLSYPYLFSKITKFSSLGFLSLVEEYPMALNALIKVGSIEDNKLESHLVKDQKVTIKLKASENNLGIVLVRFKRFGKVSDSIFFRIKEEGQDKWYYENKYNADQFLDNQYFTFGFNPIVNSKNKVYIFEIESTDGKYKNGIGISSKRPQFSFVYKYYLKDLKDYKVLFPFIFKKIIYVF